MKEHKSEPITEETFSDSGELESRIEFRIEVRAGLPTLIGEYTRYDKGEIVLNYSKNLSAMGSGTYVLTQKKLPENTKVLHDDFIKNENTDGLYYRRDGNGTEERGRWLYGYKIGQWVTSDLEGNIIEIIDYDISSPGRSLKKYTHKIAKTLLGKEKATQLVNKYLSGSRWNYK